MKKSKLFTPKKEFMATTTVGERGQIVIPKEIRDSLHLGAGSRVVVMHHGHGPVFLFPLNDMKEFMQTMSAKFAKLNDPSHV